MISQGGVCGLELGSCLPWLFIPLGVRMVSEDVVIRHQIVANVAMAKFDWWPNRIDAAQDMRDR